MASKWILETTGWEDLRLAALVAAALTVALTFMGGISFGYRTHGYAPRAEPDAPEPRG